MATALHLLIKALALGTGLTACAAIQYQIPSKDNGGTQPATAPKPQPVAYKLRMPVNDGLMSVLLLEMLQDVNAGVGRSLLILPEPFETPTSDFSWTKSAGDMESGICLGEVKPGATKAMQMTIDSDVATKFFPQRGHLKDTSFYRAFVHCIGHGLGLGHATQPDDVMQPDFSQTKNFDAFYTKIRSLTSDAPGP